MQEVNYEFFEICTCFFHEYPPRPPDLYGKEKYFPEKRFFDLQSLGGYGIMGETKINK